ncbi:MAG: hypothetical protein WBM90_13235 [Acidimicrobiia bacterium]
MKVLFLILHIGLAAAWFGHKLLIPSDLRRSLVDLDGARRLIPRIDRAERLGQTTGVGTLLTGLVLLFLVGVGTVSIAIYFGLAFVLGAIVIGAMVARPASQLLKASVAAGDLDRARDAARSISGVLAIESLLWTAALVAMLV